MSISGKNHALMAAVVVMMVLLGACASGANAALRVQNNLNSTVTVLHPLGCCSSCVPTTEKPFCPEVCEQYPNVKVKRGSEVTLDSHVGPYPLEYLQIRVRGEVYCVPGTDLYRLTATAVLVVGPGHGACPDSLLAFFIERWEGYGVCLEFCRRHEG